MSETIGTPIDLLIPGEFHRIRDLVELQPYIRRVVADDRWAASQGWQAPILSEPAYQGYDAVIELGYQGWPQQPLPLATHTQGFHQWKDRWGSYPPLDLARPWITLPPLPHRWGTACLPIGFTETWFELKYGLVELLQEIFGNDCAMMPIAQEGSRWTMTLGTPAKSRRPWYTWVEAAAFISACDLMLADCAALHVLAVAVGTPVVLMEPMEARHNPIFYPLGMDGSRVQIVRGNDGKPTTDVWAVAEAIGTRIVATRLG